MMASGTMPYGTVVYPSPELPRVARVTYRTAGVRVPPGWELCTRRRASDDAPLLEFLRGHARQPAKADPARPVGPSPAQSKPVINERICDICGAELLAFAHDPQPLCNDCVEYAGFLQETYETGSGTSTIAQSSRCPTLHLYSEFSSGATALLPE